MIRNYRDLTRWEMEQVDRENTIVLIPLGALEQHGNQAPLGTDDIIAEAMSQEIKKALEAEGEEDLSLIHIFWTLDISTRTAIFTRIKRAFIPGGRTGLRHARRMLGGGLIISVFPRA